MAKKTNFVSGMDGLFSNVQPEQNIKNIQDIQNISDIKDIYIYSFKMPGEWKQVLSDEAWQRRISIKQLLTEIVGEWIKQNGKAAESPETASAPSSVSGLENSIR